MDDLIINDRYTLPGGELWFTASRSGGPGGQHANKTSSRVTLYWRPGQSTMFDEATRERVLRKLATRIDTDGVLQVNVDDHRSQFQNREIARERLAELVREALKRPRPRHATRPTRGAVERRIGEKKKRGEVKSGRGQRFDGD